MARFLRAWLRSTNPPLLENQRRSSVEAGGDRSAVTGGTRVLSDHIKVKITANPGETFLDRIDRAGGRCRTTEDAQRNCTEHSSGRLDDHLPAGGCDPTALRNLFRLSTDRVCSRIAARLFDPHDYWRTAFRHRIAGMDRLVQHNVLAMSGRSVEAAGDVNTLLLDKTGTITLGNRQAARFIPAPGVTSRNGGCSAALIPCGRNSGRPLDRGACQGEICAPRKGTWFP